MLLCEVHPNHEQIAFSLIAQIPPPLHPHPTSSAARWRMDHEVPGSWMVTESEVEVTLDSLCELPKLSGKTEGTASLQQPLVDKA